jgi:hypothetical protein
MPLQRVGHSFTHLLVCCGSVGEDDMNRFGELGGVPGDGSVSTHARDYFIHGHWADKVAW